MDSGADPIKLLDLPGQFLDKVVEILGKVGVELPALMLQIFLLVLVLIALFVTGRALFPDPRSAKLPSVLSVSALGLVATGMPVVHFMAGLYRYQFKRYDDTRREFAQYVSSPNAAADNATLATAYQLLGASALMARGSVFQADPRAADYFSRAVAATPYDAAAYSLRALATLALRQEAAGALTDLEQALRLDPTNTAASRITGSIHQQLKAPTSGTLKRMLRDGSNPDVQRRLTDMVTQYPEAAKGQ